MKLKGKTTEQLEKALLTARYPKRGYIIHLLRRYGKEPITSE